MHHLIQSFLYALKQILHKNFYRKLLAYSCIIGGMKYDENEELPVEQWKPNDKYWEGELPSIYDLDIIVDEMNNQRDDINQTFKVNVSFWDRNEVRNLMKSFEQLYHGFCQVNNRKLTLLETSAKLNDSIKLSFWKTFMVLLKINKV